jgi:hypothetical protein
VVPFCHPFHEYPRDFRRYTPDGLLQLCHDFKIISTGWRSGPTATWLVFTLEYMKSWFKGPWLRSGVHFVVGWILFPLRYLDAFWYWKKTTQRMGNHHYLYAEKIAETGRGP